MEIIPISPTPAQAFDIVLGGQNCTINLYQKSTGVFIDVAIDGNAIITGRACRDRVRVVRYTYLGFVGDIAFFDQQGASDPDYAGFGSRYKLVYLP